MQPVERVPVAALPCSKPIVQREVSSARTASSSILSVLMSTDASSPVGRGSSCPTDHRVNRADQRTVEDTIFLLLLSGKPSNLNRRRARVVEDTARQRLPLQQVAYAWLELVGPEGRQKRSPLQKHLRAPSHPRGGGSAHALCRRWRMRRRLRGAGSRRLGCQFASSLSPMLFVTVVRTPGFLPNLVSPIPDGFVVQRHMGRSHTMRWISHGGRVAGRKGIVQRVVQFGLLSWGWR
jgi:hypothetical protein